METKKAIIEQFGVAYSALAKVYDLAEDDLGTSEWFCEGYPFGSDLLEFLSSFGEYISNLEEGQ